MGIFDSSETLLYWKILKLNNDNYLQHSKNLSISQNKSKERTGNTDDNTVGNRDCRKPSISHLHLLSSFLLVSAFCNRENFVET